MTINRDAIRAGSAKAITTDEIPYLEQLGAVVKATRKRAGLTLREAADLAGLHYMSWYRIELGTRRVQSSTLLRMAAALAPLVGEEAERLHRHFVEQIGPALGQRGGRRMRQDDAA